MYAYRSSKDKERTTEKNNLLLNILFITAPFFIINVFALSSLSKFTDYSAVRIAKHIPNPQHIEGQIRLNSYTVGSGRNKSHYEDVVLNEPSQQQPLRLVCNFMDRFKSCPLLENFQQQKSVSVITQTTVSLSIQKFWCYRSQQTTQPSVAKTSCRSIINNEAIF